MIIQYKYRYLLLIYTLCHTAVNHGMLLDGNDAETCSLLCEQCNASGIFSNDYCECTFPDDNNEGRKCIQWLQRKIQTIDLNVLSDDLTDEERNVRSILKSRRRLRIGDADKVAQYFINGGPSAGHSHFIRMAYDSGDSSTPNSFSGAADKRNPESEFHDVSLNSPVSWSTHSSPLYVVPEAASQENPATLDPRERPSIFGTTKSVFSYPTNGWYGLINPLLESVAHPYEPNQHGLPLHHALLRTAALPTQFLQTLFGHRLSNRYPNPLQDGLPNVPFVNKIHDKTVDDAATSYDSSIVARNNMDKSDLYNVAASAPGSDFPLKSTQFANMPYIFGTDALYQPVQHRYFGSPSSPYAYYNPFINVLHPLYGYVLQPISHLQNTPDQMISTSHYDYTNNANSGQQSDVSVAAQAESTDNQRKGLNNIVANIISKGRKVENDENKS